MVLNDSAEMKMDSVEIVKERKKEISLHHKPNAENQQVSADTHCPLI